jgi:hypothetical protein
VGFGEHSKLRIVQGFHFCLFQTIELPESIEIVDDGVFLHCNPLRLVRMRGNPKLVRFSGMRPDQEYISRGGTRRMIEFGPNADISQMSMRRFSDDIVMQPGSTHDRLYQWYTADVGPAEQEPTFIRYSELSMRRFRGELEWEIAVWIDEEE